MCHKFSRVRPGIQCSCAPLRLSHLANILQQEKNKTVKDTNVNKTVTLNKWSRVIILCACHIRWETTIPAYTWPGSAGLFMHRIINPIWFFCLVKNHDTITRGTLIFQASWLWHICEQRKQMSQYKGRYRHKLAFMSGPPLGCLCNPCTLTSLDRYWSSRTPLCLTI